VKDRIAILLSVLILVGSSIGLLCAWNGEGKVFYEGSEVFATEQEYKEFKLSFTDPRVRLLDAAVLSSEPPIVVKFKARVLDFDYEFPYGERSIYGWLSKGVGGLAAFTFLCFAALYFTILPIWSLHSRFS